MKKYKGWEIAKLISEGKLEGKKIELLNGDFDGNLPYMVNRAAMWDIECEREIGNSLLTDVKNEYIIPQEPVTFMDCVNSYKKVRVEHKLIHSIEPKLRKSDMYIKEFNEGDFMPINFLIELLGYSLTYGGIRKVILEGKWYIDNED